MGMEFFHTVKVSWELSANRGLSSLDQTLLAQFRITFQLPPSFRTQHNILKCFSLTLTIIILGAGCHIRKANTTQVGRTQL